MKRAFSLFTCLFAAMLGLPSGVVWAQRTSGKPAVAVKAATPALPVPPAPTLPSDLTFSQEVAGRKRLFALRDAIRSAPAFGYTARITTIAGTDSPASMTETCRAELPAGRLYLTNEQVRGKGKTVRRAIAAPGTLLVTRFTETGDGKAPPVREYSRVSLDETMPLAYALSATDFESGTAGRQWLLADTAPLLRRGRVWQGPPARIESGIYIYLDTILEYEKTEEGQGRSTATSRRYVLSPKDNRLYKFEEWIIRQDNRAGRKATASVTYRREDYTEWQSPPTPYPAATYDQALPGTYRETPLARPIDPLPPLPADTDPKAVALLDRWREGQARWLSYSATVEQTFRQTERAKGSRPVPDALRNFQSRYTIQLRRAASEPGGFQMRLAQQAINSNGNPRAPQNALYVSDGSTLLFVNQVSGQRQNYRLQAPVDLWRRLNATRFNDYSALTWLYTDTPRPWNYTKVSYGGKETTDEGENVEVVVVEQKQNNGNRRGQAMEGVMTSRIGLGADGLPRFMELTIRTDINGAFERDMPPITTVLTRFRNVHLDSQPADSAFVVK